MDFFCRKRARSDSPPRATAPVKRHGSCPVTQRPQPARPESRPELCPFLAGLFRPRSAKAGLPAVRRGSSREPGSTAGERVPLLADNSKGADPPGSAVPSPLRCQPSPPTAELAALESMGPEEPVEEPPSAAGPTGAAGLLEMGTKQPTPVPGRKVLHGSLQDLSKATATQMPSPERRLFRRPLGKGAKDTDKWKRESKYVQTQPLYQDYWLKRLKAAERKPKEPSFRVDASLSIAGLLSSSLLGAASQISSRDYSFCFWQEIPEVKSRRLLESLSPRQHRLQEAMFEMITSEASYLRSLSVATSHFKGSLVLRETLTRAEVHRLFSNLQQVSPGARGAHGQGCLPGGAGGRGPEALPCLPQGLHSLRHQPDVPGTAHAAADAGELALPAGPQEAGGAAGVPAAAPEILPGAALPEDHPPEDPAGEHPEAGPRGLRAGQLHQRGPDGRGRDRVGLQRERAAHEADRGAGAAGEASRVRKDEVHPAHQPGPLAGQGGGVLPGPHPGGGRGVQTPPEHQAHPPAPPQRPAAFVPPEGRRQVFRQGLRPDLPRESGAPPSQAAGAPRHGLPPVPLPQPPRGQR
ncbi:rho guanine nucleotide exchange factor 19-like isoform X4 [Mauremys mutica]|uniref:rho guanine nucleotide exchange factor 19-like isoform X4 n=1 Tax=Mauremys mutica TaxID=74926 RepID=UPI001D1340E8|nr:rho guanine nucleotide exchange factor 19-like isoform X4 [Mauremys mutica]